MYCSSIYGCEYVIAHQIHLKTMTACPNVCLTVKIATNLGEVQFSQDHISETVISGCLRSVASLRARYPLGGTSGILGVHEMTRNGITLLLADFVS